VIGDERHPRRALRLVVATGHGGDRRCLKVLVPDDRRIAADSDVARILSESVPRADATAIGALTFAVSPAPTRSTRWPITIESSAFMSITVPDRRPRAIPGSMRV